MGSGDGALLTSTIVVVVCGDTREGRKGIMTGRNYHWELKMSTFFFLKLKNSSTNTLYWCSQLLIVHCLQAAKTYTHSQTSTDRVFLFTKVPLLSVAN